MSRKPIAPCTSIWVLSQETKVRRQPCFSLLNRTSGLRTVSTKIMAQAARMPPPTCQNGSLRLSTMVFINHLLFESPRVMYLHIAGQGDPIAIAKTVHMALRLSKTPFTPPVPSGVSQPLDPDTTHLHATLKTHGTVTNGIYQVSFPRAASIQADGIEMPPAMGVAPAWNFQP